MSSDNIENNSNEQNYNTENCKNNNCNNQNYNSSNSDASDKKSIGLDKFSYADFVLLSSTISYAIAEELNETDLQLFLAFLGMVSSDIAMLTIKQRIESAQSAIDGSIDVIPEEIAEEVLTVGGRSNNKKNDNKKRYRKIKRVKYKTKSKK